MDIVVSDYGSEDEDGVRNAVETAGARVVRTPRQGPWSRARALNAGVLATSTDYCITTDADMIFSPDCAERILALLETDPATVHLVQCRDLSEDFTAGTIGESDCDTLEANSLFRPRWGMGGLIAFPRQAFDRIRGYESRMEIYGGEDIDFATRLRRAGYRLNWIDDRAVRIYHIWHPSTRDAVQRDPEQSAAQNLNRDIMLNDKTWIRNLNTFRIGGLAKPVATVAIATQNRAEYLRDAINSVLAQTIQDIEVVIVDDGSDDATPDVLRAFDDPRIRVLTQPKSGVAAARNRLVNEAKADLIVVHDDDDIMLPNRIEAHFSQLEAELIGTYGGWIDFDNATGEMWINQGREFKDASFIYSGKVLAHGTSMFRTEILRRHRYREELRAGVDFNLLSRLANAGYRLAHTHHIHIMRRLHDVNLTTTSSIPSFKRFLPVGR
jgi:glycosyltransferase involved in cell wall biosynthesis